MSSQERWLRFFNRVVYNALAPLYNSIDWLSFGAWWRLVRRALDYVPEDARVLEIGFGPGKLHAELARRSRFCAGLDRAWGMCRFTSRRLQAQNLPRRLVQGSVFELPYASNQFDCVVSTFAFSGFPDAQQAMQEMVRVTAPGGRVVLVDIFLPEDNNRLGVFLARLWERMGDFLYDQPAIMRDCQLEVVTSEIFGPGKHIRAVVGQKANPASET